QSGAVSCPGDRLWWRRRAGSGPRGCELVAVELAEVVGHHQQSPLGAHLDPAAPVKAVDAVVVLGVAEQRLDGLCAFAVEPLAELGREHAAHPLVTPAGPPASGGTAAALVGRNQDGDALVGGHLVHVLLVPVAGV